MPQTAYLQLLDVPPSDAGATCPVIMSDDGVFVFGYRTASGHCAVTRVESCLIFKFGYPNDEALTGHRYAAIGLKYYEAYEVKQSEWIQEMEEANRAHRGHDANMFSSYRHFVFCFHDSVLEFVAGDQPNFNVAPGKIHQMVAKVFVDAVSEFASQ